MQKLNDVSHLLAVAALSLAALAGRPISAATSPTLAFSASAYGTFAVAGKAVSSPPTAVVSIGSGGSGCGTTQVGASKTGSAGSVIDAPTITSGTIETSVSSTSNSATATSDVRQINLAGGLITAQEAKAVSTTTSTSSGLTVSAAGSVFTGLVVAGVSRAPNVAANTTIPLPGFGKVVLNEQSSLLGPTQGGLTVNMIHVYVTLPNALGIPTGTQIIVSNAHSALSVVSGPGVLGGTAYGVSVNGTTVHSGPTAPETMPCQGTNGAVLSDSVSSVSVPLALSSGTVVDTVEGTVTDTEAIGETTSTVNGIKVLGTLITADKVKADAHASTTDGTNFEFSDSGSSVSNLKAPGLPGVSNSVPANTVLPLPGVGTLYLHRVITTDNFIEVRMIEVVVTQTNSFGLPVGTDIRVGVASASLHSLAKP